MENTNHSLFQYFVLFLMLWGVFTILEYTNGGVGWPACYYHWFAGLLTLVAAGVIGLPVVLATTAHPYGGTAAALVAFALGCGILWLAVRYIGIPVFRWLTHPRPRLLPTATLVLVTAALFGGFIHVMTACVQKHPLPAPAFAGSLNGGHGELIPKWKPAFGLSDGKSAVFLDLRNTTLVVFLGEDRLQCQISGKETRFSDPKHSVKVPFSPNTALFFRRGKEVARCPLKPETLDADLYLNLSDGDLYIFLWEYADQQKNEELKGFVSGFKGYFE